MPKNRPTPGRLPPSSAAALGRLDRSPDIAERVARFLLVIVLLVVLALAFAIASATYSQVRARATTQSADRHRAVARLLADVPTPTDHAWAQSQLEPGTAVWHDGAGSAHRITVIVPARARAGLEVPVWLDRNGSPTTRPLSDSDVLWQTVGQGVLAFSWLALIACGGYRLFRVLLARRPSRRWAADWAAVEPSWTRRI